MSAILKQQKLLTWTIVTLIGWTIAASIQPQSDHGLFTIAQALSSPLSIAIIGLMQMLLVWNRQQLRSELLKILVIQLASAIVLQVLILMASWFLAVMAIVTLGKGSVWSSFSDASTIILLVFGIVSHAIVSQFYICSFAKRRVSRIARRTRPLQNQLRNLTS